MASLKERLQEILIRDQIITPAQLEAAIEEQKKFGGELSKILVKLNFISEDQLTNLLSEGLGLPLMNINRLKVPAEVIGLIPQDVAVKYKILPVARIGDHLTLAMIDPLDIFALDNVKALTGLVVNPVVGRTKDIVKAISTYYSTDSNVDFTLADESSVRHVSGTGITGRVALTGEIYVTEDIQKDPVLVILNGERERLQHVHGGISLPLRAQEKIIGVMHIWSSRPRIFNETEIRLLTALAENTSSAIHRAILFEQTLEHASELATAYDNTLAGWARALELRDELTEGHTRRVTELTLKLARALEIPENEIIHIRRGALLHDIGKMGIPDSILHKPGAFTAQERKIMQQHTQYAYDMLVSIPFLQAALDIPYCHHEHWDGAGYPRGLKGEDIPLSARIFSIIDVWDALTSDRPYRQAWSKEKTCEYILERSGKQFDSKIVEAFFSVIAEND